MSMEYRYQGEMIALSANDAALLHGCNISYPRLPVLIYQFSSRYLFTNCRCRYGRNKVYLMYWNYRCSNELRLKPLVFSANLIALS